MRDLPWAAAFGEAYCFGNSRGEAVRAAAFRHAVYTVAEVRRLVEAAGFATEAPYGATGGTPYAVGDARLIAVFERRP